MGGNLKICTFLFTPIYCRPNFWFTGCFLVFWRYASWCLSSVLVCFFWDLTLAGVCAKSQGGIPRLKVFNKWFVCWTVLSDALMLRFGLIRKIGLPLIKSQGSQTYICYINNPITLLNLSVKTVKANIFESANFKWNCWTPYAKSRGGFSLAGVCWNHMMGYQGRTWV